MSRIWRAALDVIRLTFAHERLEAAPAQSPTRGARASRNLRRLFALERLPLDPPASPGSSRRPWLHWLFVPEPLPQDPGAPSRRTRSRLATLFALESLPRDPVPPRRPRSRLAALFAPEKLDDPQ